MIFFPFSYFIIDRVHYKWQCGPEGAGIFYMKQELIDKFDPEFRNYIRVQLPDGISFSHRDHDNMSSWDHPFLPNANKFDMGVCVTPYCSGGTRPSSSTRRWA